MDGNFKIQNCCSMASAGSGSSTVTCAKRVEPANHSRKPGVVSGSNKGMRGEAKGKGKAVEGKPRAEGGKKKLYLDKRVGFKDVRCFPKPTWLKNMSRTVTRR